MLFKKLFLCWQEYRCSRDTVQSSHVYKVSLRSCFKSYFRLLNAWGQWCITQAVWSPNGRRRLSSRSADRVQWFFFFKAGSLFRVSTSLKSRSVAGLCDRSAASPLPMVDVAVPGICLPVWPWHSLETVVHRLVNSGAAAADSDMLHQNSRDDATSAEHCRVCGGNFLLEVCSCFSQTLRLLCFFAV